MPRGEKPMYSAREAFCTNWKAHRILNFLKFILGSQNHFSFRLKSSARSLSPTSDHHLGNKAEALSATSSHFSNSSRDRDYATSLGSHFQSLTTFSVKKIFWYSTSPGTARGYVLLSLVAREERPISILLQHPFRQLNYFPSQQVPSN